MIASQTFLSSVGSTTKASPFSWSCDLFNKVTSPRAPKLAFALLSMTVQGQFTCSNSELKLRLGATFLVALCYALGVLTKACMMTFYPPAPAGLPRRAIRKATTFLMVRITPTFMLNCKICTDIGSCQFSPLPNEDVESYINNL